MARRLRVQFEGAIFHVINRGNYRRDIFGSVGAAQAFEAVLDETCRRFGWQVNAYVLMRNHFHLALTTPQVNLIEGMHWLQSTYATRFNRFRVERGHLFQGRYQALLVENSAALVRVVDYIHLNPVRAGLVMADQANTFRWSSLLRMRRDRPTWLKPADWLSSLGMTDDATGWRAYASRLVELAGTADQQKEEQELCHGWAIGTQGWRRAIAKDHQHLALYQGIEHSELLEIKRMRWQVTLERLLGESGRTTPELASSTKSVEWKCQLAIRLRNEAGAPYAWIAEALRMGSPNSVRSWVCRRRGILKNQQVSA